MQTLRQEYKCKQRKQFIWEVIPENASKEVQKQDRKGRQP